MKALVCRINLHSHIFFDQLCQSNEEQKSQIEKMMAGKGRGGYKGVK